MASNDAASSSTVSVHSKWSGNRPENMISSGEMICRVVFLVKGCCTTKKEARQQAMQA